MSVLTLELGRERPLVVLALGAHADDIEIGCGGTLLRWVAEQRIAEAHWWVFSAHGPRADEARTGAGRILGERGTGVVVDALEDGFFPDAWGALKRRFETLRRSVEPDVIFTHRLEDRHQDHRAVAELTWNTFRDHLILEYEIPKYEGDLGLPNVYAPLSQEQATAKVAAILESFPSQRERDWFEERTFLGLLRVRGLEARAPSGYAEAFTGRKLVL